MTNAIANLPRKWHILAGVSVLLLLLPLVPNAYLLVIMTLVFLWAFLGESWNIIGGYGGQLSLGHSVYFGLGAYGMILLARYFDIPPLLGIFVGAAVAVIITLLIAFPTFKLEGAFFAMATFASVEIFNIGFSSFLPYFTGGSTEFTMPSPTIPSYLRFAYFQSYNSYEFYYFAFLLMIVSIYITHRVEKSALGKRLQAISEDQVSAESLGINSRRVKLQAMMLSALLTAIGGSFYIAYINVINPDVVFNFSIAFEMVLISILGGQGTVMGPIAGAFVLVPLSQGMDALLGGRFPGSDLVVYGIIIILIMYKAPRGIMGFFRNRSITSTSS